MQFTTFFVAVFAAFASIAVAAPGFMPQEEESERFNFDEMFDFEENNNQNININQNDNINLNEQENFSFLERFEEEGFQDFCFLDEEGELQLLGRRSLAKRSMERGFSQLDNFEFNNNQNANVNQNANLQENFLQNFDEFREERDNFGGFGMDRLMDCFFDGEVLRRK